MLRFSTSGKTAHRSEGISLDIKKLKKLEATFGTISAIIALVTQIHELWAEKEEEKR